MIARIIINDAQVVIVTIHLIVKKSCPNIYGHPVKFWFSILKRALHLLHESSA